MPKQVKFNGQVHNFPDDASDDEIRQALSGEPGGNVLDDPNNVYIGQSNGVPVYQHPPGVPKPPLPQVGAVDHALGVADQVAPQVIGRGSNALALGEAGSAFGPWGAGIGALVGGLLPPDDKPGSSIGATVANMAFNKVFPEVNAASKLLRVGRGLLNAGTTTAAAYGGAVADQQFGGVPINTQYGKIAFFGAAGATANTLKAFTAPRILANGPIGAANQTVQDLTGQSIPTSVSQQTGTLGGLNQFVQGTPATKDLAMRQSAAAAQVVQKIAGKSPDEILDVVKGANNDVKEASRSIWGSMLDQYTRSNATTVSEAQPSNILGSDGNPFMNFVQKIQNQDDISWQKFGDMHHLDQSDINNLRAAVKQPSADFIDQFLGGRGQASPAAQLANTMMKVLPEEAKSQFGTALVLRAIDRSGSVVDTVDGPMLTGPSFNKAIQNAGALKQVLDPDQYTALKKLGMIMQAVNPAKAASDPGASQRVLGYLANKYTFTLAGITAGALTGAHKPDIAGQVAGGVLGGIGGGMVTLGLSTVLGRILTHPEAMGLLQKAAQGDADSASAFLRGIISHGDSAMNPQQGSQSPTHSTRFDGFFPKK
jgi:hypothetical protein